MEVDKYTALPAEAANFVSNGGFEHPIAYAAGAVFVAGAGAVAARYKHMRDSAEALRLPDPDMEASAHGAAKRHRVGQFAAGVAAFAALSSGIADTAEPYTEESHNLIDNAAVVVDTSYNMYAPDVDDGGERTTRLQAAVNGITRLEDLADVDVTFIAAGDEAEQMGTIDDRSGRAELVENFESYISERKNRSGADMAGALKIADAIEADKMLMFTGSVDSVASEVREESGKDEEEESESGEDRVSIVSAGTPGTTVEYIGSEREAELDHAGIEEAVGADNAHQANSIEEVQAIVDSIVREHYVETKREDFDEFETVRNMAAAALAAGVAVNAIKGAALPYARRRTGGEQ